MPKFNDYETSDEVSEIMHNMLGHYSNVFQGFDLGKVGFVHTKKKKSKRAIKVHSVKYPVDVWCTKTYIVEVFDDKWGGMSEKKRSISVFRAMLAMPDGGFDEQSKNYGKIRKPDIEMYTEEYVVCGGKTNWEDYQDEDLNAPSVPSDKSPITLDDIASVGRGSELEESEE